MHWVQCGISGLLFDLFPVGKKIRWYNYISNLTYWQDAIWLEACKEVNNRLRGDSSNDGGTGLEENTIESCNNFLQIFSPVSERMRCSGRDRWVGPEQEPGPSRRRENRER